MVTGPQVSGANGDAPSDAVSDVSEAAEGVGGPTTHAPTPEPLRAFVWPCKKRRAHGPHEDCPGVRAHPNTMIGRP